MARTRAGANSDQRARLMEACSLTFAKKGFRETTVGDIVEVAGVSRPIFYKHFEGKEAAIQAVLDELLSDWEAGNNATTGESPSANIRIRIANAVAFALERPLLQAMFQQDLPLILAEHSAAFQAANKESVRSFERIIQAGQEAGEFDPDLNPSLTAETVQSISFVLTERALGLAVGLPVLRREVVDHTITLLIRGLMPRSEVSTSFSQKEEKAEERS